MLGLVVVLALAQPWGGNRPERAWQRAWDRNTFYQPFAFFEVAPESGLGMGSPCSCVNVVGVRGEAITHLRSGAATCSKQGLAKTGIAVGDLIECGTDLPRVETSGGVLGLRYDPARTNDAPRSEEFDNATWAQSYDAVARQPIVTANAALSPKNTMTADRIQVGATTSGQYGYIWQGPFTNETRVVSLFVRGVSGSGSLNVISGPGPNVCIVCNYVPESYTRCNVTSVVNGGSYFFIGNDSFSVPCGTNNKGAVDAYIWGAQHEVGNSVTSYIPTGAVAASRSAEGASSSVALPNGAGCLAATLETTAVTLSNGRLVSAWLDANNRFESYIDVTSPTVFISVGGVSESSFTTAATMPGGPFRVIATRVPSSSRSVQLVGTSPTTAVSALGVFAPTTLYFGRFGSSLANQPSGILTRIQVDPDPSRCRP